MISVVELEYSINDNNLVVSYTIHIRKPKVAPFIGKVTIRVANTANVEFNNLTYTFTLENPKMSRDTLVKRSHVLGAVPCEQICLKIEDLYGCVSDCAFINVSSDASRKISAKFYCGRIKLDLGTHGTGVGVCAVTVSEFSNAAGGSPTKIVLTTPTLQPEGLLPWVLFHKDSSYAIAVENFGCLVLHTEGYTTAPSTYLAFNYSKPIKVQVIKFKVTHIQSDRIYFAFLNFAGGYQGIQATPDKRINGCKNILISSQWNDRDMPAAITTSNERNLDEIFGGEGTGVKSMMDYNWKQNVDYYMAVHAELDSSSGSADTVGITRYVRECTNPTWTFISATKSKHYGQLLGKSVTSFLEAWTNESIQEGTFYQRAVIYGGWALDEEYKWLPKSDLRNIEVAASNSILDPNNDLYSAGYDDSAFYYAHGYNKISGEIATPPEECKLATPAYDDSDRENTGKYERRYFLNKDKLTAAPTMDELVPSSKLVVVAAAITAAVRISVDTDIPYYKIEHKIGDSVTIHSTHSTKNKMIEVAAVAAAAVVTTVYSIFGQITTVTTNIQPLAATVRFGKLNLQAKLAVSNIYMTWNNIVPMGTYRIRLSQGSKIIFDSDFTITGTSHVVQFVETKDNTIITKNNKHIYVKSWNEIVALQNSVKNRLVRASVTGKSTRGILTPVMFIVVVV